MRKSKTEKIMSVILVLMAIIMLLAACGETTEKKTPDEDAQVKEADNTDTEANDEDSTGDTIKIGGLAPLTGDVSIYGIAADNGAQLAMKEVNEKGGVLGKKIEYIVYDEKGDSVEATNAYNRLVNEDKIVALVGDVTSGPSITVAQRAALDNMPMITPTGTSADITEQGPNVFRACFIDDTQGELMATFIAKEMKLTKAALIYNISDNYSQGLADAFLGRCETEGVEIVANENYSSGDTDFKTQLTRILAAEPEVLYVPNYYNDNIMIVRQAKQVGLDVPFLGGDGWDGVLSENVIGEDKNDADGAYFTNHYAPDDPNEKLQNFLTAYRDAYGMEAISFAALGYDGAMMMAQAIEEAGSTDADAIINALKNIEYEGVTGNITFDENNNPIKPVTIILIKDGNYTLFSKMQSDE
ncbi:MAG TPA: ABC transporter substrate-binding protein [Clostridiaceae bacterium]|nr:ABC transporter substrate-binding protein [Clostridiaceae bacterium]